MDWTRLSAKEIAVRVRERLVTAATIAAATLERISSRAAIHAWAHVDPERVLSIARAIDARDTTNLPLAGVPIGIKDLMDTCDQPTTYGSRIYAGHRPTSEASIVTRLREAGAIVIGKTVTTEFAFRYPGPTTHPHEPGHTPGGSSSGSAAAVADFHVPLATATQTAGSVIRPATFCGVVGFKPTYGEFPYAGIKAGAESLDTVGLIARSVEDIICTRSAIVSARLEASPAASSPRPKIGLCRTPSWSRADQEARGCLEASALRLRHAGATVVDLELPASCDGLLDSHRTIMLFEMARSFADEAARQHELLSPTFREAIASGRSIALDAYRAAQTHAERSRPALDALLVDCDFLLTLATPGEAPAGLEFTGDPLFNSIWTVLHAPCIGLPAGKGAKGLPLGVQLVGTRRQDERLLRWAAWAEPLLGELIP
jgi:Asp-tRNA(Asn)/Glu-tRNA(Gln) amidotransferase A subunit family amidase